MPRSEIISPIGVVFLETTPGGTRSVAANIRQVAVSLLDDQRIDGCLVGEVPFQVEWRNGVKLLLGCDALPGIELGGSGGQDLHAIEAEGEGISGALAIRDDAWFSRRFGCRADWASTRRGALLRLRAFQTSPAAFEFAVAWTTAPRSDAEKIAPFFAVDFALGS